MFRCPCAARLVVFLLVCSASVTFADPALMLSGTFRGRLESLDGQFRQVGSASDLQLATRVTARVDFDATEHWRLSGELMDSRVFLTDDGSLVNTTMVNVTELINANLRWTSNDGNESVTVGRYTLDLGSRRLIGRNNFRNTTNAFQGLLGKWTPVTGVTVTAFYNYPSIIRPTARQALLDATFEDDDRGSTQRLYGVHIENSGLAADLRSEAYWIGLDESDAASRATADRRLDTAGVRLRRTKSPEHWDFELETMWQWGTRRATTSQADTKNLDVRAGLLHVDAGYSFDGARRLRLAFDWISGDKSPLDDRYGRFDTLFGPSVPDFGFTGIYGALARANLIAPELRYEWTTGRTDAYVAWRPVWVDQPADAFGRSGVSGASGGDRFAGQQVHGRVRFWFAQRSANFDVGGAWLQGGDFFDANLPGFDHAVYVYAAINARF
ncbi:MAG: alginate export family protein [Pseudomonadales bacterium]|nr:alginate export family protein [Pseudomonadales bacterium]